MGREAPNGHTKIGKTEKPAMQKGTRGLACCLIAGMSLSGCILLGVDYESTFTEQTVASGFEGRV